MAFAMVPSGLALNTRELPSGASAISVRKGPSGILVNCQPVGRWITSGAAAAFAVDVIQRAKTAETAVRIFFLFMGAPCSFISRSFREREDSRSGR